MGDGQADGPDARVRCREMQSPGNAASQPASSMLREEKTSAVCTLYSVLLTVSALSMISKCRAAQGSTGQRAQTALSGCASDGGARMGTNPRRLGRSRRHQTGSQLIILFQWQRVWHVFPFPPPHGLGFAPSVTSPRPPHHPIRGRSGLLVTSAP